jgi:hypothetical protein
MIKTFIWIQVREQAKIAYQNSLGLWLRPRIRDLIVLDFDNYSDSYLVDKTIEMIKTSGKIVVLIEAEELDHCGQITKFLNKLIRIGHKNILILFNGRNSIIEKMLKIIDKDQLITEFNMDKQGDILLNFLK